MKLEIGEKYLMFKGTSHADVDSYGSVYYHNAYDDTMIKIKKYEVLNEKFFKVYFYEEDEMPIDRNHFIIFCEDEIYNSLIDDLIMDRNNNKVKKCYSENEIPYIFSRINEKYFEVKQRIDETHQQYGDKIAELRKLLYEEGLNSKIEMSELDAYEKGVNEFLTDKP